MLPTRKSVPRSSRQMDHTKTSWRTQRPHKDVKRHKLKWMDMSPILQVWPKHLVRHIEREKKTRQTENEIVRQYQGMNRPGVCQVLQSSGEQRNWRKLVVKSSVVPKWPSRLRDRWDEVRWGEDAGVTVKEKKLHLTGQTLQYTCVMKMTKHTRAVWTFQASRKQKLLFLWRPFSLTNDVKCCIWMDYHAQPPTVGSCRHGN